MPRLRCPNCDQSVPIERGDKRVECPDCGATGKVPPHLRREKPSGSGAQSSRSTSTSSGRKEEKAAQDGRSGDGPGNRCSTCGNPVESGAKFCSHCGERLSPPASRQARGQGSGRQSGAKDVEPSNSRSPGGSGSSRKDRGGPKRPVQKASQDKSKKVAGLLGIFLGGVGVHKFYLGRHGLGLVYLLFFWTFIPALIGLVEGVRYLWMDESEFRAKYGPDPIPKAPAKPTLTVSGPLTVKTGLIKNNFPVAVFTDGKRIGFKELPGGWQMGLVLGLAILGSLLLINLTRGILLAGLINAIVVGGGAWVGRSLAKRRARKELQSLEPRSLLESPDEAFDLSNIRGLSHSDGLFSSKLKIETATGAYKIRGKEDKLKDIHRRLHGASR